MNPTKKLFVVTYTHENWADYTEAKFQSMEHALEFASYVTNANYKVFAVETLTK
jgi:hypothetical protein